MSKFKGILDSHKRPTPAESQAKAKTKGKRSDPDYGQVSAYIRKETYRNVKIALLQEAEKRDFSDLVEALLSEWLSNQ
ncbi:hypothetical protein IQ219_12430 [Synechocystis sp. LEGE 06083]|uniref:hypothetical protein n=1 Tax=Synechocystis sp. LEGE 06083 TaxID=915336 RepID=UPI0018829AC9|nr:hypothetical protein [Synechocystis sp. LEGE 06083]MBE9196093.1 hypothetical protein [Synechocystis sp. LEGE 06083]